MIIHKLIKKSSNRQIIRCVKLESDYMYVVFMSSFNTGFLSIKISEIYYTLNFLIHADLNVWIIRDDVKVVQCPFKNGLVLHLQF